MLLVLPTAALAEDAAPEDEPSDEERPDGDGDPKGEPDAAPDTDSKGPGVRASAVVPVIGRLDGVSAAELNHRHPASVTAVDIDEKVPPSATVADLLEEVAGAHVRRFGGPGDPAYVGIRGSSGRQVEVWVDGMPLNAQGSGAVDLSELPLHSFDRVELFRGFAPAELGAAPMGGVVHLTTVPGRSTAPSFSLGAGSFSTRRATARGGFGGELPGAGCGDVQLSVDYEGTEGNYRYFDDNGTSYTLLDDRIRERSNNRSDRVAGVLRLRAAKGPVELSLLDHGLFDDGGVPGAGPGITTEAHLRTFQNLLGGRMKLTASKKVSLTGDLSWRTRSDHFEDPRDEIGLSTPARTDRFEQPSLGLSARLLPLPWLRVLPSIRTVFDVHEASATATDAEAPRFRAATTLHLGAALEPFEGRLSVMPGFGLFLLDNRLLGKVPFREVSVASDGEEFSVEPLPRIAIAARPTRFLTVRGAVARGFRPPSFLELFGDRGGVIGNGALLPESSWMADASVRVSGAPHPLFRGSIELGAFVQRRENGIVIIPNSQRTSLAMNLEDSRVSGVELAGGLRALKWIDLSAAFTWIESEVLAGRSGHVGRRLPGVPEWQVDLELAFDLPPWLRVAYGFHYVAGTYDSPSNLFLQAPRPIHDLTVRLQPAEHLPWVALELRNLADTTVAVQYRDPLHPVEDDRAVVPVEDFRGNPLPGRSFFVSVGWRVPLPKKRPTDDADEAARTVP